MTCAGPQGGTRVIATAPASSVPYALPPWLAGLIGGVIGVLVGALSMFVAMRFCGRQCHAQAAIRSEHVPPRFSSNTASSVFEALTHAVIAVRPDGNIIQANGAALKLFGYSSPVRRPRPAPPLTCTSACPSLRARARWPQDGLIGHPIGILLPGHTAAAHVGHLRQFGTTGLVHPAIIGKMLQVHLRCADSGMIPCQLAVTGAESHGEHLIVASIQDLRPVRLLEQVRARTCDPRPRRCSTAHATPAFIHPVTRTRAASRGGARGRGARGGRAERGQDCCGQSAAVHSVCVPHVRASRSHVDRGAAATSFTSCARR